MPIGSDSPRTPTTAQLFPYELGDVIPTLAGDMPLLASFVRRHEATQPLRGVTALFIQHQLGNQAPQVEALIALGLDPRRLFWLDIPYTSSGRFRAAMCDRLQVPEANLWINRYRVLEPYAHHQLRRTQEIVRELLARRPRRLLVLDDGAYFLEAAMSFRRQLPPVAIVEQTTRGIIKLRANPELHRFSKQFPIVNVAESMPKLTLEPPWIATAVFLALRTALDHVARRDSDFRVEPDSPCLLLGFGSIGRLVAGALRNIARVYVSDTKPARQRAAAGEGFDVWKRNSRSPRFKLVVGCSGQASFSVGDVAYLDAHAVLASASSGSVELSRHEFIDLASASQIDDIRIETRGLVEERIHQPVWIRMANRQLVLLNAGFPINFDGRLNCIPARLMQPTAMLMVHGAMQALTTRRRGLVAVDADFCADLAREFPTQLSPLERRAFADSQRESAVSEPKRTGNRAS